MLSSKSVFFGLDAVQPGEKKKCNKNFPQILIPWPSAQRERAYFSGADAFTKKAADFEFCQIYDGRIFFFSNVGGTQRRI